MLDTSFSPWPHYSAEEIKKVSSILKSGKVNYWTGTECKFFEDEFSSYIGAKYSIAVSNGTVALDLALKALNIGIDDEVIVPSRSYIASVSSVINSGAKPIFVDICRDSQNLDPKEIIKKITTKTKAILCVHLAGWPCEMDSIMKISNKYNLKVIEDCAQAHGAIYKGKSVGTIGNIGCWSFCQEKIMSTAGEGGMVTTNDKELWEKMWSYKDHGKSYDAVFNKKHPKGFRWLHESFGTNWRMTEIQAAVGRIQLRKMKKWTEIRNKYLKKIWRVARTIDGIRVPEFKCNECDCNKEKCIHAGYKCYIFVDESKLKSNYSRDRLLQEINEKGVPCFSGSCSEIYLEKAFDKTNYRPKERLAIAKELGETSLMFLIHPTLKSKEIDLTCKVISSTFKDAQKN